MKTLPLPPTYAFESMANPQAGLLEERAHAWIDDFSIFSEQVRDRYRKNRIEALAVHCFPNAGLKQLVPIARCFLVGILFDDFCNGLALDEMKASCRKVIKALSGIAPDAEGDVFFKHYAMLRNELLPIVTSRWMQRFVNHHRDWFDGLVLEYAYNNQSPVCYPSLEKYKSIREKIYGSGIICDMLEVETGFIMPEEIIQHPGIARFRQLVCLLAAWFNDIQGVAWELGKNEAMNLVLVIQNERKCTLQAAFLEAVKMHDDDLAELMEIRNSLPDFGMHNEKMKEYLDNAELFLKGHEMWYVQVTQRYR